MILTCPQCETKYKLPVDRLGREGHRVRCSNCDEIWFQMPDPDEFSHVEAGHETEPRQEEPRSFRELVDRQVEAEFQEIPDSVKPIRESIVLPKPPVKKKFSPGGALTGYGMAAGIFLMIFGSLLFWRNDVIASWQPSVLFYETIGIDVPLPGHGLSFQDVTAKASPSEEAGTEFVEVTGRIVNSTSNDQILMPVEATLRDREGKALDHWIIDIPEKIVPAQNAVSFAVSYQSKKKPDDVRLGFVIKTAGEDAGNTPAPPVGDHTLQHASE